MVRVLAIAVALSACSAHSDALHSDDADVQCMTQPMLVATHPHAVEQPTPDGQSLNDTRGWGGRLYFGYGDLTTNTGPIMVSSLDPVAGTWIDHFEYQTHRIVRFDPIEDQLWAPSGQPMSLPGQSYAVGSTDNDWGSGGVDIGRSLHVIEAVERAPGDVYLTGEDFFDEANNITSGAVWRSTNGGPFTEIFPQLSSDPNFQNNALNVWFFNAAALNGMLYVGFGWVFDGQTWGPHSGVPVDLGEFQHPTTFAGNIVSSTLGQLWAFDGTTMTDLHVTLFVGTGLEETTLTPLPIFEQTEGHLVAIDVSGAVRVTTDLETWTCAGQAPPDARSIGSLNGTIYFGGPAGRVYGFPSPSW